MSFTVPSYGFTPTSSMTSLTNSFLRFPSADTIEAGLPIHIESVARGELERTKLFACLRRTILQVLVKHLFPTRRVHVGGVRDHTVEVEEDGVVLVASYAGLHRSPPLGYRLFGCRNAVIVFYPRFCIFLLCLQRSYFAQATQMSRRLTKLGCQKRLNEIPSDGWSYGLTTHTKNIHVIVLDALSCRKMVVN